MVGPRVLLVGAVLAWLAGPGGLSPGGAPAEPPDHGGRSAADYLLDPQGRVLRWLPGRRIFEMTDVAPTVNALTMVGPGSLLVLTGLEEREAARRRPQGGAILYDVGGGRPRAVFETRFEGEGYAVAVREDTRKAYVLAHHPRSAGIDPRRAWLHAIDLESGRLTGSAALPEAPNGIAVSPRDGRLFLALVDRILTYSSSPLASSWQYRSPGVNLALHFAPGSDLLFAVRAHEIALFDPAGIAARSSAERPALKDDATRTIGLPLQAAEIVFPDESLPLLAAFGRSGPVVFVDWHAGTLLGPPEAPGALSGAVLIRYLPRAAATSGWVAFAALPAGELVEMPVPRPVAAPAAVEPPPRVPTVEAPVPAAAPTPAPTTMPSVTAPAPAVGKQAPAPGQPADQAALTRPGGRLTGQHDLVSAVVIFGPGSIVREQARAVPDAEGVWGLATPPAGVYRIVPIGEGGRPLLARPNFHTMKVPEGIGPSYDFDILGAL